MRLRLVIAGTLLVGACEGDSDVTNPPEESFTLTVTGYGTGSAFVRTDTGVTPAIDCTLTGGGAPSGTCSRSYSAGTAVAMRVTRFPGSGVIGWSGDASSCGTEHSCSITMDANKSAILQLSGGSIPEFELKSSVWYRVPGVGVIWVVEVRNNSIHTVESARVNYTSYDAAANAVVSDFVLVGPIPPSASRAKEGLAEYRGDEASVVFELGELVFAAEHPDLSAVQIVSSSWTPVPRPQGGAAILWLVELQNNSALPVFVQVDFVTYDADGRIIDHTFKVVGPVPAGGRAVSEGLADYHGTEVSVDYQVTDVSQDDLTLRRR